MNRCRFAFRVSRFASLFSLRSVRSVTLWLIPLLAGAWVASTAFGNGGPFVVKYPGGDPAAKGVLARLDPSLKPDAETRLRVAKEDLTISFETDRFGGLVAPRANVTSSETPPLVAVAAAYTIENPTDQVIEVDFGFPILRGLYMNPAAMMPMPDVHVIVQGMGREKPPYLGPSAIPNAVTRELKMGPPGMAAKPDVRAMVQGAGHEGPQYLRPFVISNSIIYGVIRQRAREAIEKGIGVDKTLAGLVADVQRQPAAKRAAVKAALVAHLTGAKKWNERDAALLAEYASIQLGPASSHPFDRGYGGIWFGGADGEAARKLLTENLGPLAAIGEQKATQFLACLAARFDALAGASYEEIFSAWGGDVRERSLDLTTGQLRPREITLDGDLAKAVMRSYVGDPTVYARVDYLDPNAKISDDEKASCKAILKNLPVVFTFAPMNLLHYRATFPAKSTQLLTVSYRQYAYLDTKAPKSYQCAYVIHPASLWTDFGPINVSVFVRKGVAFRGSVDFAKDETGQVSAPQPRFGGAANAACDVYRATLREQKKGELFFAVEADGWNKAVRTAVVSQAAAVGK